MTDMRATEAEVIAMREEISAQRALDALDDRDDAHRADDAERRNAYARLHDARKALDEARR